MLKRISLLLLLFSVCVLPASLSLFAAGLAPSAPANLQGEIVAGEARLSWAVPEDDDNVVGYNVYVNEAYSATVFSNSYSTTAKPGARYVFKVVAFDEEPRRFSPASEGLLLSESLTPENVARPPSVPSGLSGSVVGTRVSLEWKPSTDDDAVEGYNIYQNRRYIATRFETRFTGSLAAGSSNSFQVVAFDVDGNFSAMSDALILEEGVVVTESTVSLSIPTGLEGRTVTEGSHTTVTLRWIELTGMAPVAGYNVYRNNDYLTTVFTAKFTDTVPSGTDFVYQVVSFDDLGNFSPRSAPLNMPRDASRPPFFSDFSEQRLLAGEHWELILRPVHPNDDAVGILVSDLPEGMAFIDNLDGTRSLRWQPTAEDIGIYPITVTAFDLADTALRTEQTVTVSVVEGDQGVGLFSLLLADDTYNLMEGEPNGVSIPVELIRADDFTSPVSLRVDAESPADMANLSTAVTPEVLEAGDQRFAINLQLNVGVLPIEAQQRRFNITASDGIREVTTAVTVRVTPVPRDDVYLLIGQSNMVGFSEDVAKQAGAGGADAVDSRIRQANVRANDEQLYPSAASYTDTFADFLDPPYVFAEDPLHDPVDAGALGKKGTRIGLGLSFAKAALPSTTRPIVLVPAAWASSAFCNKALTMANWNAQPADNPVLGNTLLFDRALSRANKTLADTGGILRGIIWHQGESDANTDCAEFYERNLVTLVAELRTRIVQDARGPAARGPEALVPFIAATMSRGVDERGDLSLFTAEKQMVDDVHRTISSLIPHSDVVVSDDLVPANGYPCGEGSCIHFGAAALREIGVRSFDALLRAADR